MEWNDPLRSYLAPYDELIGITPGCRGILYHRLVSSQAPGDVA